MLVVKEHTSSNYSPRTYYNAKSAQLTLAFAMDFNTAGEKLTKKASYPNYIALDLRKDWIDNARNIYKEMHKRNCAVLNIAGNGIYTLNKYGLSQDSCNLHVYNCLNKIKEFLPITKIYTGGQTGVDLAGAIAGYNLGIDTEVTLPKGFIMRFQDGKDIPMTKEKVERLIMVEINENST